MRREKKEAKVFDNAMSLVTQQYWAEKTFSGSQITIAFKNCEKQEQPYNDYDAVHKLLMGGIVNLRHSELIREVQVMLKHVDRTLNELCTLCEPPYFGKKRVEFLENDGF